MKKGIYMCVCLCANSLSPYFFLHSLSHPYPMFHANILFTFFFTLITMAAAVLELKDTGLCDIQGDSSACSSACSMMDSDNNGICIYRTCYCTDDVGLDICEDDDHESCDAYCQEMSPNLLGFCMDGQCSCLS